MDPEYSLDSSLRPLDVALNFPEHFAEHFPEHFVEHFSEHFAEHFVENFAQECKVAELFAEHCTQLLAMEKIPFLHAEYFVEHNAEHFA